MAGTPEGPGLFLPRLEQRGKLLLPSAPSFSEYELRTSGLAAPAQPPETRMAAYPTSGDLGLPVHTYDELVGMVRELPFEMSMRATAILQASLGHEDVRFDAAIQLKLAERLMPGSWVLDQLTRWVAEPDRVIFTEQAGPPTSCGAVTTAAVSG